MRLRKKITIVLLGIAALLGGLFYIVSVPPEPEVEGHHFFYVGDEPFLVPIPYMYDRRVWNGARYNSFAFESSLPGLGPHAREAWREWAIGAPRLVSVSVEFAEDIIAGSTTGATLPERFAQNMINSFESRRERASQSRFGFGPYGDVEFKKNWTAFLDANRNREWELIDVSNELAWGPSLEPPEEGVETVHVAFSNGRMVIFTLCSRPTPKTSPHCVGRYHRPGDPFYISVLFDLDELDRALDIIRGSRDQLEQWNQAGRAHVNTKPRK